MEEKMVMNATMGNENVIWWLTGMVIGAAIGLILFVLLLVLGNPEAAIHVQFVPMIIGGLCFLPKDIKKLKEKKNS